MTGYGAYGVVLGVSAVSTFLLTFIVRRLAIRFGAVVKPDERRLHPKPTPTVGGAAMFLGFLIAMVVAAQLKPFQVMFRGSSEPLAVVLGASLIFANGFLDDLRELTPPAKTAGTVLACAPLIFLGAMMFYFRIPFLDFVSLSPDLQPLVTVIWVYGMTTAVNWIDGLDGLAAGIVAIAAAAFFLFSDRLSTAGLLQPTNVAPLILVIAVGVCLGFLPHNFNPARIIMGDGGALFLGMLMACSTMLVGGRVGDQFSGNTFFFFAPIFIPFFIMGVPMFDTAFAIIRRSRQRLSPSAADRGHLHYRLERMGHGHRRAVLILWAWTAILSGIVLFPTFTNKGNAVIPFLVAALGVLLYTLLHPSVRRTPGDITP